MMKKQNYADGNNKPITNDKKHFGGYFKVTFTWGVTFVAYHVLSFKITQLSQSTTLKRQLNIGNKTLKGHKEGHIISDCCNLLNCFIATGVLHCCRVVEHLKDGQ